MIYHEQMIHIFHSGICQEKLKHVYKTICKQILVAPLFIIDSHCHWSNVHQQWIR